MITLDEELENIKNDTTTIGTKPPRIQTLSDVKNSTYGTDSEVKQLISDVESDISNVLGSAVFERGVQNLKNLPEQLQIYGGQALMSLGGFVDSDKTVSMGKELIKSARGELQADEKKFWESSTPLSEKDMESFTYGLGLGIANYGSMLAIGYLNPIAGITLGSAVEIGQQAEEKIGYHIEETGDTELNKYTSQKAQKDTLYTTIYGVGSAIIEKKFGLGKQLKLVKMPITSKLKHVIETAVSEGGTETLQELYATGLDWKGGYIDSSKLPERFMGALKEGVIGAVLGGGLGVASAVNHRSQAKAILRDSLKNTVPEKDLDNVVDGIYESANDSMSTVVAQELIQSESLRNKHGAIYESIKSEVSKQIKNTGAFADVGEMKLSQYIESTAKMFADQVLGEANKRKVVIDEVVKDSEVVYKDGRLYLQGASKKTKLKRLKEKTLKSNVEKKPSLLQFIRSKGGVIDEGGELRMMDASKQFVGLVNKNGVELDRMGEALFEAGYFSERPTVAELLDYIDDELRGNKHYPMGYVLEKSVSQAENESLLDDAISEYADIMGYDISKMSFDEKQEVYDQMQRNLYASEDVIVESEEQIGESIDFDEYFQISKEAIDKLNSQKGRIELNYASLKDPIEKDYLLKQINEYSKGMSAKEKKAFDEAFKKMEETADAIYNKIKKEGVSSTFVNMNDEAVKLYKDSDGEWKPIRSIFVNNGDYEFNIDFGTVCVKRQGADTLIKILVDKDLGNQLGVVQLENIKKVLVEHGIATACDICFVETKRINARDLSNGFAYEWESVRQALGIFDDYRIGHKYEFTKEQEELIEKMVSLDYTDDDGRVISEKELEQIKNSMTKAEYKKFKDTHKQVFERVYDEIFGEGKRLGERGRRVRLTKKGVEEALDRGITAPKMRMIAKLFQQDSRLAGKFNADSLMNSEDTSELVHTYFNTDMLVALSSYAGAGTPKALLKATPYSGISWREPIDIKDNKEEIIQKLFDIGGVRGQSFSDYDPMRVIDYMQKYLDMYLRGLPSHEYTKEPSLIKTFGKFGVMFNMSIIPEVRENFAIPRGITAKEKAKYIAINKKYAGLKRATKEQIDAYNKSAKKGTVKQDLIDGNIVNVWTDENGEAWTYAWHKDSFPIDEALRLRKDNAYGGRVGIIAVGTSENQIRMMLNDPTIDMVIPYHSSGMPAHTKLMSNLYLAEDFQDFQTTKGLEKKSDDFVYNAHLQKIGDPKKTAQAYIDWCGKKYKPKFKQFINEENYYKLLEDFRGYDNDGNAVIQRAVNINNLKESDWEEFRKIAYEEILKKEKENERFKKVKSALDEGSVDNKTIELTEQEKAEAEVFKQKILDAAKYQRVDSLTKNAIINNIKKAIGNNNVVVAKQNDFLQYLYEAKGIVGNEDAIHEYRRERDGIIYGFAYKNKIYLNENYMNAHTPAHEFTHLWVKVLTEYNIVDKKTKKVTYPYKDLWEQGKKLLQSDQVWYTDGLKKFKGSDVWQEVLNDPNYYDILGNEDLIASEVLARIVGRQSELFAKAMLDPNQKMFTEKGNQRFLARAYQWLTDFFNAVARTFGWKGEPLTLQEFARMPFADMTDASRIKEFKSAFEKWSKQKDNEAEIEFMKTYDAEVKNDIKNVQERNEGLYPKARKKISEYNQVTNLPKQEKKVKGSFDALTKSIKITSEADFSTYQHEFAHFWLDNIWNYVNSGMASEKYKKEFEGIKKWLGTKGNYPTRSQHEKFARAYEKYLYKGTNADAPIGQAFKDYENFIREVYSSIVEIDTKAGVKYRAVPKLVYDFFNSMTSGTLPFYGDVEEPEKEVKKEVKEVKEFVAEETKVLEENRAKYNLKPVQTDTKTGYLTAYEKMTGEKVEAGSIELKEQMEKAESFVANNPEQAERIVNGLEQAPEGIVKNAVYIAYNNLQKKLGNTDKRVNSMLNQALELRRMGQEIASQRLAYTDEASALYWIRTVQQNKVEALADATGLKVSELSEKINSSIKSGMKEGKSAKDIAKELRNELGVTELFQEEVYPTNETDVASYNYIYKYVNEQLGLSMSMAEAETITRKADDMLASLENSMAKNGNPSVDFFVKQKDLENYANSIAPSSRARVLVSVIGRGNLLASIKSPFTNIENNMVVGILRAITRRIKLQVGKSIVSPELIKENKQYSYEIWKKTGYNVNNITPETPRNTILGEKITHSEGKGTIRWLGKLYEKSIYKWGLGWGDVISKDFAFTDYVALKATKIANGDVNRANAIFKDACLIDPQTDEGKEIRQEAIQESLIATYQNRGLLSESLLKYREGLSFGVGFGEFLVPFVKTPANVKSMELKTGFGLLKAIPSEIIKDAKAVYRIKKENPNKSLAELMKTEDFKKAVKPLEKNIELVTQNSLGLIVAWAIASSLDDDDYMPSYAFATSKDKQLAKELNIPFNAIRIGDTWISLDYFGPLASPLVGWLQARREESFFAYLKTAGIQVASLPGLGNIADLYQKIEGLAKKSKDEVVSETGDALMEQLYVRSMPAIFSDLAKALDSYERETKGDEILTKIPYAREKAFEKISVTSGKAEELGNPIYDILFGSRVKEQVTNDVADELQRLNNAGWGVSLTTVTRSGLLSELDEDTKQKVREDFAVEYSKQVKRLIKGAKYKRSSDEDKQEMINKIRRDIISGLKRRYLKKKKQ